MKAKPIYLLYFGLVGVLIGAGVSLLRTSVSEWGKSTFIKEGITIFLTLVCVAVIRIIWYQYIRKTQSLTSDTKKLGSLVVFFTGAIVGIAAANFLLILSV